MNRIKKIIGGLFIALLLLFGLSARAQQTATATAVLSGIFVVDAIVTDGGSGYGWPPSVSFVGGGGSGAAAYSSISNGVVISITVTNAGFGYTSVPQVLITPPSTTSFSSLLVLDLPLDGTVMDVGPNHFTVSANSSAFVTNRYLQAASALSLNGVNQAVTLPFNALLYPDEFTLSLWVNFQQIDAADGIWRTSNPLQDPLSGNGFQSDGSPGQFFYNDSNGTGNNALVHTSANIATGQWYQIVISRTTNSCAICFNGVKVGWQTNLTPYAKPLVAPMTFGCNQFFDASLFAFSQMTLDSVHIYNRALSDAEVQSLYAAEAVQTVPVLGIMVKTVRVSMEVLPGKT